MAKKAKKKTTRKKTARKKAPARKRLTPSKEKRGLEVADMPIALDALLARVDGPALQVAGEHRVREGLLGPEGRFREGSKLAVSRPGHRAGR